jgi:SWI/SNF-related matrix-associated actin-dependent regulator 1 of chromatin subfamily A
MTELYNFQREGVERIKALKGRALLGDHQGLGKSIQALTYAHEEKAWPCVIVCPAHLKVNWERDVEKHLGARAQVLSGRKAKRPPKGKYYVVNYDVLDSWGPKLGGASLIVLDECHYIGNRSAKRTKAAKLLCQDVEKVIAMSGTAMTNRPSELWPVLNILDPKTYSSPYRFYHRYSKPVRKPWGWEFKGASNLKELHEKLSYLMIRRTREQVLKDLPGKTRSVVPLALKKSREYVRADRELTQWLRSQRESSLHGRMKEQATGKFEELLQLAYELKKDSVYAWVDDFLSSGEKLILYCVHRKTVKELKERYGRTCVTVNGDTPKSERQKAFDRFNEDPKCALFVGNIRAAGSGWSCKSTSSVAFCELDWTPGQHSQAEARVEGIGRGTGGGVSAYYLLGAGTIEEKVARIVQRKQGDVDQVLDGGSSEDGVYVYDLLVKEMRG